MLFSKNLPSIISSLQYVHKKGAAFSRRKTELSEEEKKNLQRISSFFGTGQEESVLLANLIITYFQNEKVELKQILENLDMTIFYAAVLHNYAKPLVQRGWIHPRKNIDTHPMTGYLLDESLIRAVLTGDPASLVPQPIEETAAFLAVFGEKLKLRQRGDIGMHDILEWSGIYLQQNSKVPLADWICNRRFQPIDQLLLLCFCLEVQKGSDIIDGDDVIGSIQPDATTTYYLRKQFRNGTSPLIEQELLQYEDFDITEILWLRSTHLLQELVFDKPGERPARTMRSQFLSLQAAAEIPQVELLYEEELVAPVHQLKHLLQPQQFGSLLERMKQNGFHPGFTVLLYGHPGTGKTETVYQLARSSGRDVLMLDISSVRGMWVGETEKNMHKVFLEYKKACRHLEQTPILLFNEADAILGKRRAVERQVDQMENTMQNILLQELENFEGIFIATTNLQQNMDTAFERRFLYKIRFGAPGEQVQGQLWKKYFSHLTDEEVQWLNQRVQVTGGQLNNIRKKYMIEQILNPQVTWNKEHFLHLAGQEWWSKGMQKLPTIGFRLTG